MVNLSIGERIGSLDDLGGREGLEHFPITRDHPIDLAFKRHAEFDALKRRAEILYRAQAPRRLAP
jgi:hypothetical protein